MIFKCHKMNYISSSILNKSCVLIKNQLVQRFYSGSLEVIDMVYNKYDHFKSESSQLEPPIVIMHGLFGSKTNWQSISKALNKVTKRTVFAVDARNHGSSPHSEHFSYHHLAEDIKHLLDTLSIGKACIMGHSMGGRAAMNFSLKYPNYLEKLIIVDISPFHTSSDLNSMLNYFKIMNDIVIDNSLSIGEGRKIAKAQMMKVINNEMIVDFLLTNLIKTREGPFKWRVKLDTLEEKFRSDIAEFPLIPGVCDKPALFISGLKSDYFSNADESRVSQLFPLSQFIYLNTGHWVHAEDPNGVINAVSNFLMK